MDRFTVECIMLLFTDWQTSGYNYLPTWQAESYGSKWQANWLILWYTVFG
jgi:hypothetical protein